MRDSGRSINLSNVVDSNTQIECKFSNSARFVAVAYGVGSLALFSASVLVMVWSLYHGFHFGIGNFTGLGRWIANFALLAQFPLLHSWLLSRFGNRQLDHLAPKPIARRLRPTTYVAVASLQLLMTFCLWSPQTDVIWVPTGVALQLHQAAFLLSWLLLIKSMWDGHLGIQLGYIGWLSVLKRLPAIPWPSLPTGGVFRICRQPIYFSFMLTLWTGPVWTVDKLFTACLWTLYCVLGPRLKEKRQLKTFGEHFERYRREAPYWPLFNRNKRQSLQD